MQKLVCLCVTRLLVPVYNFIFTILGHTDYLVPYIHDGIVR